MPLFHLIISVILLLLKMYNEGSLNICQVLMDTVIVNVYHYSIFLLASEG